METVSGKRALRYGRISHSTDESTSIERQDEATGLTCKMHRWEDDLPFPTDSDVSGQHALRYR